MDEKCAMCGAAGATNSFAVADGKYCEKCGSKIGQIINRAVDAGRREGRERAAKLAEQQSDSTVKAFGQSLRGLRD
jgi:hypothetical protein